MFKNKFVRFTIVLICLICVASGCTYVFSLGELAGFVQGILWGGLANYIIHCWDERYE